VLLSFLQPATRQASTRAHHHAGLTDALTHKAPRMAVSILPSQLYNAPSSRSSPVYSGTTGGSAPRKEKCKDEKAAELYGHIMGQGSSQYTHTPSCMTATL